MLEVDGNRPTTATAHSGRALSEETLRTVCLEESKRKYPDFSYAYLGTLCKAKPHGKPSGGRIRNDPGYRAIVAEFAHAATKSSTRREPVKDLAAARLQIVDPRVRGMVTAVLGENSALKQKLQGALALLEDAPSLQLHTDGSFAMPSEQTTPVHALADVPLLPFEREALAAVLSPKQMTRNGWTRDDEGRVRDAQGVVVLPLGVATAIEKVVRVFPAV